MRAVVCGAARFWRGIRGFGVGFESLVTGWLQEFMGVLVRVALGFGGRRAAGRRVVAGQAGTKNKKARGSGQRRVLCGPGRSGDASGLPLIKNKRELGRWLNPTVPAHTAHVAAGRTCTCVRRIPLCSSNKEWERVVFG